MGTRFVKYIFNLHFCGLLEISRLLTDDSFDDLKLANIIERIDIYLKSFKDLYPIIPISAKMHNLIHYSRCIRMSGLPLSKWTMRFDSKHRYFKQVHNVTHNHINLLYSLAQRHQNLQLYHLLSETYILILDLGSEHSIDTQIKDYISIQLNNITTMKFYNHITYHRCKYTINDFIVTKRKTQQTLPQFAKINTIVYNFSNEKLYFLIEDFVSTTYCPHYTGYILAEKINAPLKLILHCSLSSIKHLFVEK
jgi:hypothetical protein